MKEKIYIKSKRSIKNKDNKRIKKDDSENNIKVHKRFKIIIVLLSILIPIIILIIILIIYYCKKN